MPVAFNECNDLLDLEKSVDLGLGPRPAQS